MSAASKKTWTIMLYLAGDNNLSDEMVWAVKEIYRIGTPKGVKVTLQFDPFARGSSTRFFVAPGRDDAIDLDGVFPLLHEEDLPESDCGDPEVLVDFILKSMTRAPADHYMLILSGHGSGVVGDFLTDDGAKKALQPGSLTIPDLRQVFARLRARLGEEYFQKRPDCTVLDVLGMDSCLMSMAEICSEVKGEVQYLVGSEGFDPNTGWPYFRLLERLRQRIKDAQVIPKPQDLVKGLVHRYITYYSDFVDADISVDISACDVSTESVGALEEAVKEFVDLYRETQHESRDLIHDVIVLAHWKAQSYKWEQYTDLWDFCDLLKSQCRLLEKKCKNTDRLSEFAEKCKMIKKALRDMVEASNYSGVDFQHSHGLSVYFPWSRSSFADEYRSTAFAMRTGWDYFLDGYIEGTRRETRKRKLGAEPVEGLALEPDTPILLALGEVEGEPGTEEATIVFSRKGRVTAPASRSAFAPFDRVTAPASRVTAPASRVTAPASRVTAPASRVTAPASRIAEYVNSLLSVAPSTMKNPPMACDRVLRFDLQDWREIPKSHDLKKRLLDFLQDLGGSEVGEEQAKLVAEVVKELELEESDS